MSEDSSPPAAKPAVDFAAFQQLDIRAGTIEAVDDFAEARTPAYKLWIDFGEAIGRRQTSAQLTANHAKADLEGRQVAALVNIPPKRVAGFTSECLVLGFTDSEGGIVLVGPDTSVPNGSALH